MRRKNTPPAAKATQPKAPATIPPMVPPLRPEAAAEGVAVMDADPVRDEDQLGLADALRDEDRVGVREGVSEGVAVAEGDAVAVTDEEAVAVTEWEAVALTDADRVAELERKSSGRYDTHTSYLSADNQYAASTIRYHVASMA